MTTATQATVTDSEITVVVTEEAQFADQLRTEQKMTDTEIKDLYTRPPSDLQVQHHRAKSAYTARRWSRDAMQGALHTALNYIEDLGFTGYLDGTMTLEVHDQNVTATFKTKLLDPSLIVDNAKRIWDEDDHE